ncbi:dipicolinate synthase subunit B [Pelagirhabdus alkalitolerans]|uniref:Dipicolinate synthase subunit B n=1 Tax=Pelagirhabdus alkalitolerans TaxID=1612202 RepID=A0A1G6H5B8_9BACI|nr:dipicolinate synthase subunit B [Pelagirhabdus alkalitolerans]
MLHGKRIGFGLTGSHCTFKNIFNVLKKLVELEADVYPILSHSVQNVSSRFGEAEDHYKTIKDITGKTPIVTIEDAEQFGPIVPLDCMVIAPITGNSIAKFASAITDTPVLMAAKATLRNQSPVILSISTNDALGLNGVNIMKLMATKGIYFVPFGQDQPYKKPNSLIAHVETLPDTVEYALTHQQIQPVLRSF